MQHKVIPHDNALLVNGNSDNNVVFEQCFNTQTIKNHCILQQIIVM